MPFGRVNLVDEEMMRALADAGCVELRFGIGSGSDRILSEIRKGFTCAQVLDVLPAAIGMFPRVDAFYVWGFPFETMQDPGNSDSCGAHSPRIEPHNLATRTA